jgi:LuxR family maltose regulon positive regulatory protein
MLNHQILSTKLNRPRCFQPYFKRERLDNLLEKNIDRIETIISAGAGYGKSTLVSQWIKNKQAVCISCHEDTDSNEKIYVLSRKMKMGLSSINLIFKLQFHFYSRSLINS